MLSWYTLTLFDYVVVAAAIFGAMYLLNKILRRFGVNREASMGYALILPWLVLARDDGTVTWEGPLPADPDAFLAKLAEHKK